MEWNLEIDAIALSFPFIFDVKFWKTQIDAVVLLSTIMPLHSKRTLFIGWKSAETTCLNWLIKIKLSLKTIILDKGCKANTIWKEHPSKGWDRVPVWWLLDKFIMTGSTERFRSSRQSYHRWEHGGGLGSYLFPRRKLRHSWCPEENLQHVSVSVMVKYYM